GAFVIQQVERRPIVLHLIFHCEQTPTKTGVDTLNRCSMAFNLVPVLLLDEIAKVVVEIIFTLAAHGSNHTARISPRAREPLTLLVDIHIVAKALIGRPSESFVFKQA